jgi:hypothetical protein
MTGRSNGVLLKGTTIRQQLPTSIYDHPDFPDGGGHTYDWLIWLLLRDWKRH